MYSRVRKNLNEEIDKMLFIEILFSRRLRVDYPDFNYDKKTRERICVYVDVKGLNGSCVHDTFLITFNV